MSPELPPITLIARMTAEAETAGRVTPVRDLRIYDPFWLKMLELDGVHFYWAPALHYRSTSADLRP